MDQRTKEAIRYLGYGKHTVDVQTLVMISDSFSELEHYADARHIYRIFALETIANDRFSIGCNEYKSRNLGKNLIGCDQVIVFAATLGIQVDRMLRMWSIDDMAKAVVLQACAAALLEEYCNERQSEIAGKLEEEGRYLRPRFSPGYGDFSITYQRSLLEMVQADKTIGLTMTDSSMLAPSKSITAIIGVSNVNQSCHRSGCEECDKIDCAYRRN